MKLGLLITSITLLGACIHLPSEEPKFKEGELYTIEMPSDLHAPDYWTTLSHPIIDEINGVTEKNLVLIFDSGIGGRVLLGEDFIFAIRNSSAKIKCIAKGTNSSTSFLVLLSCPRIAAYRDAKFMWHTLRTNDPPSVLTLERMINITKSFMYNQGRWDQYILERTGLPLYKIKRMRDTAIPIGVEELSAYGLKIEIIDN